MKLIFLFLLLSTSVFADSIAPIPIADGDGVGITSTNPLFVTGGGGGGVQQIKDALNTNASGSGAAATVSTVQTLTAPPNAVGFILMNLDVSTTNMRWALGRTATTTLGQQLQPGRDTGFVPAGSNISIVAESGTVTYDVQWVSQ